MKRHWYIPAAIVLVLMVVGFLAGWVQLSLGPDTWAVAASRNGDVEPAVVAPGGFTWRIARLVPGLLTVHRFTLSVQRVDQAVTASLPSGTAYSFLAGQPVDFSFEVRLSVRYRIRPSALPDLVRTGGLRPDNLADWYDAVNAEIPRQTRDIALDLDRVPGDAGDPLAAAISAALPDRFPYLELLTVTPVVVKAPDLDLYRALKESGLRVIAAREQSMKALAPRLAAEEAAEQTSVRRHEASIGVLEKYGELLGKYPALIKFLFLTSTRNLSAKDLQGMDVLQALNALDALD
jgi:hypothetical protein